MSDQTDRKPTCVVVAGPNGSGKTSLLSCLDDLQRIIGEWINPDEIAQADFRGWNDPESILLAAAEAERRRFAALADRRDFTFETVLSTTAKLDFLAHVKTLGYFVRGYFVATNNPTINAARVMGRMMEGGHSVPIDKILSRYYRSIANLPALIAIADQVQVFDNSIDHHSHRHVMTFVNGHLHRMRLPNEAIPSWCAQVEAAVGVSGIKNEIVVKTPGL